MVLSRLGKEKEENKVREMKQEASTWIKIVPYIFTCPYDLESIQ